jgi:hypothetical protein
MYRNIRSIKNAVQMEQKQMRLKRLGSWSFFRVKEREDRKDV